MPRRMDSRTLALLTSALFIPWVSGCATKSYVRDRVSELNTTVEGEHQTMRSDLERTGRRASDAGARADAANTAATHAQSLALGDVEFHTTGAYEVRFAFDSAVISDGSKETLDQAVSSLQSNPRYLVDIVGNADSQGAEAYNNELSRRRAEAVLHYLVQHGPGPVGRYAIVGLGASEPVMLAGSTKEDHRASRRVGISLLERVEPGTVTNDQTTPPQISSSDQEKTDSRIQDPKKTEIQRADLNGTRR